MRKRSSIYAVALLLLCCVSCKKDSDDTGGLPEPDPKPANYISDYPKNLNVVYFIPKDKSTLNNYQERISGIMLHTQNWFKKEMVRTGFGEKTFGLLTDEENPNDVKITVIRGEQNASAYPYDGGGATAAAEIREYFSENPEESTSEHTVVFMPSIHGDHGWDAGGVPFYGLGKWCFVLDYKYFDMKTWRDGSREGSTNWIGGTIHEIGHALNLPHNQHKANDGWTSMMSWGNHEYNDTPDQVHLTKASAAILNNNQVFNLDPDRQFYTEIPTRDIESLKIFADDENLYVQSKFTSSIPVDAVIAFNDPKTSETDANYNAITWVDTTVENDSISITMPLSGITPDYKQYPFELRLGFCHTDGSLSYESFSYQYVNDKPEINVNVFPVAEVDKSGWTITDVSSEETVGGSEHKGYATNVIDNTANTFWHSQWLNAQPVYPHSLTINLNSNQTINGFTFLHRGSKYNGRPKSITLEISSDGNTYESLGDFTLSDGSAKQVLALTASVSAMYVRLTVNSGYDNNSGENVFFTHLAEIGLY